MAAHESAVAVDHWQSGGVAVGGVSEGAAIGEGQSVVTTRPAQ